MSENNPGLYPKKNNPVEDGFPSPINTSDKVVYRPSIFNLSPFQTFSWIVPRRAQKQWPSPHFNQAMAQSHKNSTPEQASFDTDLAMAP